MAYENKGQVISLQAAADTTRFTAVKVSADDTFAAAGAGDTVIGFLQNTVVKDEAGGVLISGVTFANAGGTIAAGEEVMPATGGKVIKAAAPAEAGTNYGCGIALNGGANGEVISVLFRVGKAYVTA